MLAGMDVSGDQRSGNEKFMAIVFGTDDAVNAMTRRLGSETIHMNMIKSPSVGKNIIDSVSFNGRECIAFCVHLEKNRTLARVKELVARRHRYVNKIKIAQTYHGLAWGMMRDPVESFLRRHRCEVRSIEFQCDNDCRNFAKDAGWRRVSEGPAHTLADIVAWANSHGLEPDGTVTMNLADPLDAATTRRFK